MRPSRSSSAFTLVELLVAISVLAIICVMLSALVGGVQKGTGSSSRRLDADQQAQLVFDQIAADLDAAVLRSDALFVLSNDGGENPLLACLSRVPSFSGNRNLSLVCYRIALGSESGSPTPAGHLCLQRSAKSLDWTTAGAFLGTKPDGSLLRIADLPATLQPSPSDYDVLGDGVIRMVICCQLKSTGLLQAAPPFKPSPYQGDIAISQIAALIVALVVLDDTSLRLLTANQVTRIAGRFPDPQDAVLPSLRWNQIAGDASQFGGLPPRAIASLRVYQRFYPIATP